MEGPARSSTWVGPAGKVPSGLGLSFMQTSERWVTRPGLELDQVARPGAGLALASVYGTLGAWVMWMSGA